MKFPRFIIWLKLLGVCSFLSCTRPSAVYLSFFSDQDDLSEIPVISPEIPSETPSPEPSPAPPTPPTPEVPATPEPDCGCDSKAFVEEYTQRKVRVFYRKSSYDDSEFMLLVLIDDVRRLGSLCNAETLKKEHLELLEFAPYSFGRDAEKMGKYLEFECDFQLKRKCGEPTLIGKIQHIKPSSIKILSGSFLK